MRKSQIAMFVILGLILAAGFMLIFSFKDTIVDQASKVGIIKETAVNEGTMKIKEEITDCLEKEAQDSLEKIGLQGGYRIFDKEIQYMLISAVTWLPGYEGTAYLYDKGKNNVPTAAQMQDEIAKELSTRTKNCEKSFETEATKVSYGRASPRTEIKDDKVYFKTSWTISVTKGETSEKIRSIDFDIPVRLGKIRETAEGIVTLQGKNVCLSCLADLGSKNGMTIDIDKVGNDLVYIIRDEQSKINGESYIFLMAAKV